MSYDFEMVNLCDVLKGHYSIFKMDKMERIAQNPKDDKILLYQVQWLKYYMYFIKCSD